MEEDYYSDDDEKVEAKVNIYYANSTKKFKITLSEKQLSATIKEIKKVNKQIDSFFNDFKDKNKNYNILVKN